MGIGSKVLEGRVQLKEIEIRDNKLIQICSMMEKCSSLLLFINVIFNILLVILFIILNRFIDNQK